MVARLSLAQHGQAARFSFEDSGLPAHAKVELPPDREPLKMLASLNLPVDSVNIAAASNWNVARLPLVFRTWAVTGVSRLSRELAGALSKDSSSLDALATKIAPGLTREQVSVASNVVGFSKPKAMQIIAAKELDGLARKISAVHPDDLTELGIKDTAVHRAALINPEIQAVKQQQPWKVAPAVEGLQRYSRTIAGLFDDTTAGQRISTLLAQTASPNDVWRVYDIMKTSKTPEQASLRVIHLAIEDYNRLLPRVEKPLSRSVVWRTFHVPNSAIDSVVTADGPAADEPGFVHVLGHGYELRTPPVERLPGSFETSPKSEPERTSQSPKAPELPRSSGPTQSSGRSRASRVPRPGNDVPNATRDGREALAWDK
jgi:hypothetical protein